MVREERLELSLLLCSELASKANAAADFAIPAYFIKNFSFLDFQDAANTSIIFLAFNCCSRLYIRRKNLGTENHRLAVYSFLVAVSAYVQFYGRGGGGRTHINLGSAPSAFRKF